MTKTDAEKQAERWARAARYALGRLTKEDAREMHWEIGQTACLYSVVLLSDDDVLESLEGCHEFTGPPEKLREYADRAAEEVADYDWSNEYSMAKEQALDLVKD